MLSSKKTVRKQIRVTAQEDQKFSESSRLWLTTPVLNHCKVVNLYFKGYESLEPHCLTKD